MPAGGQNKIKWSAKEIAEIERMAGNGMTIQQIADIYDLDKRTIERHVRDDPKFAAAISRGRAKAADVITQSAFKQAASGKCPAMTIFWLKTRQGWKEPREVDLNVRDLSEYKHIANDELKAIVADDAE